MPEWLTVPTRFLTISPAEAHFERRGFRAVEPAIQDRLEAIGETFLYGYNEALHARQQQGLRERLSRVSSELRGFAYEGAGMSLMLKDHLSPFGPRDRLHSFLAADGSPHSYMLHVGAGWALARLSWLRLRVEQTIQGLDPLLRWLAVDGFGFHEGYFHWSESIDKGRIPVRLKGYARRAFDQGLGRSLWFVNGADPERIPVTIATFDKGRRGDLWSGVGLACGYAGGVSEYAMRRVEGAAGRYSAELAQGVAFAAKARERAGNRTQHTDLACWIFCGMDSRAAAAITDDALTELPLDGAGAQPAYEVWRRRVQMAVRSRQQLKEAFA